MISFNENEEKTTIRKGIPSTRYFLGMRRRPLGWVKVLGELIDNSLDAGADEITIEFDRGSLTIMDDGVGCKDLIEMLTLGEHVGHDMASGGLGCYGVGLKDAAVWLWGKTSVASVYKGTLGRLDVDWDEYAEAGDWEMKQVDSKLVSGSTKKGTQITFSNMTRTLGQGLDLDVVVTKLSAIFAPALQSGKTITLRHFGGSRVFPLSSPDMPKLSEEMHGCIEVYGKQAQIYAGIVSDDGIQVNPMPGLNYEFNHRRILVNDLMGCGTAAHERISGVVKLLGDGWVLTRNKDNIDEHRRELGEQVEEFLRPMLEKVKAEERIIGTAALREDVERLLARVLIKKSGQKERRDQVREDVGAVEPVGTGRKRNPKKVHPDETLNRVLADGKAWAFRVVNERESGVSGIGEVRAKDRVILFNRQHPMIEFYEKEESGRQGFLFASLCLMMIAQYHSTLPDGAQTDILVLENLGVTNFEPQAMFLQALTVLLADLASVYKEEALLKAV